MAATRSAHAVKVFYDVASPYSWLGFELILRYERRWNLDLEVLPFFLGGVMSATGNTPPGMLPSRGMYMRKDVKRLAAYTGVPLQEPEDPTVIMRTLAAQRLLTAVRLDGSREQLIALTRSLWKRIWSKDLEITSPEGLMAAAVDSGLSEEASRAFLAATGEKRVKTALKDVTDLAIAGGAFGAPTFFVKRAGKGEEEMFFGSDRFHLMADFLGEDWDGPFPGEAKL